MYRLAQYRYMAVFTALALVLSFSVALIVPSATAVEEPAAGQETFASSEIAGIDEYGDVGEQYTGGYWQWLLESDVSLGNPTLTVLYDDGSTSTTAGVMIADGQWVFDVYHDGINGAPVGAPVSATIDYVLAAEQPAATVESVPETPQTAPEGLTADENPEQQIDEGSNTEGNNDESSVNEEGSNQDANNNSDQGSNPDVNSGDTSSGDETATETTGEASNEGGIAAGGGGPTHQRAPAPEFGGIAAGGQDPAPPIMNLKIVKSNGLETCTTVYLKDAHLSARSDTFTEGSDDGGLSDPVVWHFLLNQAGDGAPRATLHYSIIVSGSTITGSVEAVNDGATQHFYVGTSGDGQINGVQTDNFACVQLGTMNGNQYPNLNLSHVRHDYPSGTGNVEIHKTFSDGNPTEVPFTLTKWTKASHSDTWHSTTLNGTTSGHILVFAGLEPTKNPDGPGYPRVKYELAENMPPELTGYQSSWTNGTQIPVCANDTNVVSITNTAVPVSGSSLTIYKTFDPDSSQEATFKLTKWIWQSGHYVQAPDMPLTAETSGHVVTFGNLVPSAHNSVKYTLEEVVPAGWESDWWNEDMGGRPHEIRINTGANVLDVKNTLKDCSLIVNKTFTDGNPDNIEVTFKLSFGPIVVREYKTVGGQVMFNNSPAQLNDFPGLYLVPGLTYRLEEVIPDGYNSSIAGGVDVVFGSGAHYGGSIMGGCPCQNTFVDVVNWPDKGRLEIVKKFQGTEADPGFSAEFQLWQGSTQIDGSKFTDGTSPAVFEDLEPGVYTVKEVNIPAGWSSSIGTGIDVTIAEGLTTTLNVDNYKNGCIEVHKILIDAEHPTGIPHEGIEFYLFDNKPVRYTMAGAGGTWPMTDETDVNGIASFCGLEPGWYWLTEESLPEGMISTLGCGRCVKVNPGETTVVTVYNSVDIPDGSIVVIKQYDDGCTTDIDFTLTPSSPVSGSSISYKTENLVKVISDLQPGSEYTLNETVPSGYTVDENDQGQTVRVPRKGIKVYYIRNYAVPGRIIVNKSYSDGVDRDTIFELRQNSTLVTSGTTSGGQVIFEDVLAGTYNLTEQVPGGWTSSLGSGLDIVLEPGETEIVTVTNTSTPPGGETPGGENPGGPPPEGEETATTTTTVETTPTAVTPTSVIPTHIAELTPETTAVVPSVAEVAPAETAALPSTGAESSSGITFMALILASCGAILRRTAR